MIVVTEDNWHEFKREANKALPNELVLGRKYNSSLLLLDLVDRYKFTPEQALRVVKERYEEEMSKKAKTEVVLRPVPDNAWYLVFTRVHVSERRRRTR
jgi:hypothetical protein